MPLDTKGLAALMDAEAYPVMLEEYAAIAPVRERLANRVHTVDASTIHGTKGTVIGTLGRPTEIQHGEEIPADQIAKAYTWYMRTHKLGSRIDITKEEMESAEAAGKIGSLVTAFAAQWGRQFALEKEERAANLFLNGTLTAGSKADFNGSFLGEVDPYPKFIYDNLPFFDTAHNDNAAGTTYANHTAVAALSQATLQTGLTLLNYTNARDYRSARFLQRANVLVVPTALRFTAVELLKSELKPGSANNDVNSVMGSVEPIVWDFLTDTDMWILGDTKQPMGFEIWDSGAPQMRLYFDEKTQTHSIFVTSYYGQSVTNWRPWYCANKAAA